MKMQTDGLGFDFCVFTDYDSSEETALYEIGSYTCEPGYSYGPIIRPRGIIHYVISGKGMLQIGGKEFHIHGGQLFFIPPNVSAYYEADHDDPWVYRWLHLGGTVVHSVLKDIGVDTDHPVLDIINPRKPGKKKFTEVLQDIFDHYECEYYCVGKLYELIDFFKTEYTHTDESTSDNLKLQYVRTVIKYIQLKYSEQIRMDDISGACGLNRSYLSRLFHAATGSTVKGYLLFYRMNTAERLLRETDNSIQYISTAVGYTDIFTFSKAFKKFADQTPSEYRKRFQ